ncbi:MAG: hypothetical protein LKI26_07575 [Bifidobacterium tibiigranuli]|jgi:ABC-type molybdate transport system ATPase subunit|nr:hypothetical protein [Bifidobacterium tibiigranuli]
MKLAQLGHHTNADPDQVLRELDLARLVSRHPLSLSGGEQQHLVVTGARVADRPITAVIRRKLSDTKKPQNR